VLAHTDDIRIRELKELNAKRRTGDGGQTEKIQRT